MTVVAHTSAGFDQEQLDLLKRTLATDLTNDEFALFSQVCVRTGLDPFMKQIYAVKRSGKMTLQVGIDGYRLIADRTGKYAGSDDAEYVGERAEKGATVPDMARVTVWKLVANLRVAFTASARWAEYYPGDGNIGIMWRKMPHVMLAKVAEALALRKAFPAELSGLYTSDEMDQAEYVDVPSNEPPPELISEEQAAELAARLEAAGRALGAYPDEWIAHTLPPLSTLRSEHRMAVEHYELALSILTDVEAQIAGDPGEPSGETGNDAETVDVAVSPGTDEREPGEREKVAQAQLAAVAEA